MDDYTRLQAASLHEHEGVTTPIEIRIQDYGRYKVLSCQGFEVIVFLKSDDTPKYPMALVGDDTGCSTNADFDILMALLQQAKEIMGGGV